MHLLSYLDDWLVVAESKDLLLQDRDLLLQMCDNLGIMINWDKSDFQPSTRLQYIGMLIDSSLERVFPLQVRLDRFREVAMSFLRLLSLPAGM